jgi:predicted DNA-binding protein YlxM (UPF0122 family)
VKQVGRIRKSSLNKSEMYPDYASRLSDDDIKKIRSFLGKLSLKEIAHKFGITKSYASRILSNKRRPDPSKGVVCPKCGREK